MPDSAELLKSVRELREGIAHLVIALERDYAKRQEIEERFTTKGSSQRKFWGSALVALLMIIVSYFATVSTVSGCFLSNAPYPKVCSAIPGFDKMQERNEKIFEEFRNLQKAVKQQAGRQ